MVKTEKYLIITDSGKYSSCLSDKFYSRYKVKEYKNLFEIVKITIKESKHRREIIPELLSEACQDIQYSTKYINKNKTDVILVREQYDSYDMSIFDVYDNSGCLRCRKDVWRTLARSSRFILGHIERTKPNAPFEIENPLVFDTLESAKLFLELKE